MTELTSQTCVACQFDAPKVEGGEREELSQQIPDWNVIVVDDVERLQRVFKFDNFVKALEFTNLVGDLAEKEDHHPMLVTEWGKVEVQWWTHKIKGLHRNDFITASKTDEIFAKF